MTSLDHLIVFFLFVVAPYWTALDYRALVRKVRAGDPMARLRAFRLTVIIAWSFTLLLLVWWGVSGRGLAAMGFVLPTGLRTIAGLVLTAFALAFLAQQWRAITKLEGQGLDRLRAQAASVADLMPRTDLEHRWWKAVSVTAGITEEIAYRGFLIWYLGQWMSPWIAALVGAVAFGLGHFYQGGTGVVKTGVIGLVMGLLFVGTGSLLWPIILHTAIDLQGGAAAKRLLVEDAQGA
jgi:membrane protease YdiL (CAAX protease family)